MILVCKEGCPKCVSVRKEQPELKYVEIPEMSIGLGDTIAKITHFFGIDPCPGCRLRQNWCNKWIPYPWRRKKVSPYILDVKRKVYKLGVKRFPVLVDKEFTKIIKSYE